MVPIGQLGGRFDSAMDSRYRGASASFRRFAVAYWSLKVLEGRVGLRFAGTLLQQLLLSIERRIAGAFFPEREAEELSALERASLQRAMLREAVSHPDIEGYWLGNPLRLGDSLGPRFDSSAPNSIERIAGRIAYRGKRGGSELRVVDNVIARPPAVATPNVEPKPEPQVEPERKPDAVIAE